MFYCIIFIISRLNYAILFSVLVGFSHSCMNNDKFCFIVLTIYARCAVTWVLTPEYHDGHLGTRSTSQLLKNKKFADRQTDGRSNSNISFTSWQGFYLKGGFSVLTFLVLCAPRVALSHVIQELVEVDLAIPILVQFLKDVLHFLSVYLGVYPPHAFVQAIGIKCPSVGGVQHLKKLNTRMTYILFIFSLYFMELILVLVVVVVAIYL